MDPEETESAPEAVEEVIEEVQEAETPEEAEEAVEEIIEEVAEPEELPDQWLRNSVAELTTAIANIRSDLAEQAILIRSTLNIPVTEEDTAAAELLELKAIFGED